MLYSVFYKKPPRDKLLIGQVGLNLPAGLDQQKELVKEVKNKYGADIEFIAAMENKVMLTKRTAEEISAHTTK